MAANIIDIEAAGMIAQILHPTDPGLIMLDFGAAFPSLLHEWLFFVLESMHIPANLLAFLRGIYSSGPSWVVHRGMRHGAIFIRRGSRQGCPASGVLFALACDPLFKWLVRLSLVLAGHYEPTQTTSPSSCTH